MKLKGILNKKSEMMFTKKYKILGIMFPIIEKNMYTIIV